MTKFIDFGLIFSTSSKLRLRLANAKSFDVFMAETVLDPNRVIDYIVAAAKRTHKIRKWWYFYRCASSGYTMWDYFNSLRIIN
jgi:hypothetical protein